jgi:exonuclease III
MSDCDWFWLQKVVADEGGYTYCNEICNIYTMMLLIYHCLISNNLLRKYDSVDIIDNVDNCSDHLPVLVKCNVNLYHTFI